MPVINGTSVGGMTLQADYTVTTNTSANTSTVAVTLKLVSHYALYASALAGSYISVGGSKSNYSKSISYGGSTTTTTTLATKTVTVAHNNDGTGTCNISGTFVMNGSYRGSYIGTMSVNSTITLPKIARASGLTVPTSVNTGSALSGTITPSSSTFNHKVLLKIGSTTKHTISVAAGTNSWSYTIPHDWLPNTTSQVMSVVLETYNGTTLVASVTKSTTANVPTSIVPSVSAFTAAIAANGLSGLYVQGKTTAKLTATATAGSGATIKSYTYSGPNVNTDATTVNSITTSIIRSSGNLTYTVSVQDSRGRKASKTVVIYVYPYSTPVIGSVSVQRCTSDGTISDSGTYARYTVNSAYSPINGKNTRTITAAWSSNNGSTYSGETTLQAATDTSGSKTGTYGTGTFVISSAYLIRFTIKDSYGATYNTTVSLQSASRPINIRSNGKGVAIGAMSTKNAFEVSMDADFNNNVNIDGNLTITGAFNHFGLGGTAKQVGGDWNTACGDVTGYFRGAGLANAPTDSGNWWYVHQIAHDAKYKVQIAYGYHNGSLRYQRCLNNGTWSAWTRDMFMNDIGISKAQAGYATLPNGFIIQWGLATTPANTNGMDITFPIAFPTNVRSVSCQNNYTNIRNVAYWVSSMGVNGFRMGAYVTGNNAIPAVVTYAYWIAVGY